jgi:hypothetical protein
MCHAEVAGFSAAEGSAFFQKQQILRFAQDDTRAQPKALIHHQLPLTQTLLFCATLGANS